MKNEIQNNIVLLEVLHLPAIFNHLVSGSRLLQKGLYLHGGDQTTKLFIRQYWNSISPYLG